MALFLIALLWSPLAWGQSGCYVAETVCTWKTIGLAKAPVLSHGAAANQFPRLVSFKSTVNEGESVSRLAVTYRIEDLQLDGAVDDSVFTLDPAAFQRVWASDRRVFLKNLPSTCKKKKD